MQSGPTSRLRERRRRNERGRTDLPTWRGLLDRVLRSGEGIREPGGKTEKEAAKRLKARLGEKHGDRFIGPEQERVMVDDLLNSFALDLEAKRCEGAQVAPQSQRRDRFEHSSVTPGSGRVDKTDGSLHSEPNARPGKKRKAPAIVNRELAALAGRSTSRESRARFHGFPTSRCSRRTTRGRASSRRTSSRPSSARSRSRSPTSPVRVSRVGGRERSSRWTWENVDRAAGEVRIVTSKNGHGRVLPLTGALKDLIERRWTAREHKTREKSDGDLPYVFHDDGEPVGDFRKAWASAHAEGEGAGEALP